MKKSLILSGLLWLGVVACDAGVSVPAICWWGGTGSISRVDMETSVQLGGWANAANWVGSTYATNTGNVAVFVWCVTNLWGSGVVGTSASFTNVLVLDYVYNAGGASGSSVAEYYSGSGGVTTHTWSTGALSGSWPGITNIVPTYDTSGMCAAGCFSVSSVGVTNEVYQPVGASRSSGTVFHLQILWFVGFAFSAFAMWFALRT